MEVCSLILDMDRDYRIQVVSLILRRGLTHAFLPGPSLDELPVLTVETDELVNLIVWLPLPQERCLDHLDASCRV